MEGSPEDPVCIFVRKIQQKEVCHGKGKRPHQIADQTCCSQNDRDWKEFFKGIFGNDIKKQLQRQQGDIFSGGYKKPYTDAGVGVFQKTGQKISDRSRLPVLKIQKDRGDTYTEQADDQRREKARRQTGSQSQIFIGKMERNCARRTVIAVIRSRLQTATFRCPRRACLASAKSLAFVL